MFISVTDKGMSPHEYSRSCKCRGCAAVTKAKRRAAWYAVPLAILASVVVGFLAGEVLGGFVGVVGTLIAVGIFTSLSPKTEVLKPDDPNEMLIKED